MQRQDTNLSNVQSEFEKIINNLYSYRDSDLALHKVEKQVLQQLLRLGYHLIIMYISLMKDRFNHPSTGQQNKGQHKRVYFSIFGEVAYSRTKTYVIKAKKVGYPLDQKLGLGSCKYSYLLQDWIGYSASDASYEESVVLLNKIFDLRIFGSQAERISTQMSGYIEDYYIQKEADTDQGKYFVAGFDDKGVPIRAGSLGREAGSPAVRLGKGQKRDVKRHSTVSVTYSFDPNYRESEEVLRKLFKEDTEEKNPETESSQLRYNKHLRAFMCSKNRAITYGFEDIVKRMGATPAPIVVLIDGDRGLEGEVDRVSEKMGIKKQIKAKVLDFIHVTEYIWKVANAHFGEKDVTRLAWVREQCELVLKSQTEKVIATCEKLKSLYGEGRSKYDKIQATVTYFQNHTHMMDYADYLKKGYPISTGAIESACGHFVKNRMERSGMHWTEDGAQNMLNLRAANKNKDWDDFMEFYISSQAAEKYRVVA